MACTFTITSISRDCSGNIGGVRCVYIAPRDSVSAQGSPGQTENTWDVYLSGADGIFKRLGVRPYGSSFASTAQVDEDNGTAYFRDEAVVVIPRMSQEHFYKLQLIWGSDPVVVVEDMNGAKIVMGYTQSASSIIDARVRISAVEIGSGTAKSDRNGLQVTFSCEHAEVPFMLDPSTPSSLFDVEDACTMPEPEPDNP